MTAGVLEARHGTITVLTLSNPGKLNAFSQSLRDELTAAFSRQNRDPSCRAIVLTGAEGNFSSGAEMQGWNEKTVQECRARLKRGGAALMREMIAGSKPIVAAVEGYAYGAGLALACAADHVIASTEAKFCCAFTKVGFIPDLALLFSLPRRVGATRAKQLIALADTIGGVEAQRIGLVDETTGPGEALARALRVAERYTESPPLAFELMKSAFARDLEDAIQTEIDLQPYAWLSKDHEEGKLAFAEKRKPRFTGN